MELRTMLTEHHLNGIIVPIITPLDDRGNLDIKSFEELVQRLVKTGIRGLIINDINGESPVNELSELESLIKAARKAMNASQTIPLIVGVGSNNTPTAIIKIAHAKSIGADAALVVAPDYLHPSRKAIIQHFQSLLEVDFPIILNDIPNRAGRSLDIDIIKTIMKMDHITGLKESTNDMRRIYKLARSISKPLLCGEDDLFFAALCSGAKGGILVSANLDSEQFVQVYELFKAGEIEASNKLFNELLPLVHFLFSEQNLAPIKWLLAQQGHIRSDQLRLPINKFKREKASHF